MSYMFFLSQAPDYAVVQKSLEGLYPSLENRIQFKWISQRIRSMEGIWVEAGRTLSAKYKLTERKAIHVMPIPNWSALYSTCLTELECDPYGFWLF